MGATDIGRARVRVDFDDSDVTAGIGRVRGGLLGGMGGIGRLGGLALAAGIVSGAAAATGALFRVGDTIDQVQDTIRVGTGATGDALAGLVDVAKDIGETVPATFGDIGTAVADLNTRLGLTGEPLEAMASQILELSRITGTDVASNIADITRVFGDWSIATEDQAAAMDTIFRASQATGAGIGQLSSRVVQFGAPLRQLGFGFEESLALLGKFEREGVNTELVMGSMRIALTKMARAGEEPIETFARMVDAIKSAGSAGEANTLALEVFGARAGPDMAAAIREGRFELGELYAQVAAGSETILSAGADTRDFAESWQILKNQATSALAPLGSAVFGAVSDIVGSLSDAGIFDRVGEWAQSLGDALAGVDFGAIFEGIDFGAILTVLNPIGAALRGLAPVFPVLADAILQVAGAVGDALAVVLPAVVPILETLAEVVADLAPVVADVAGVIADTLAEVLVDLAPVIAEVASVLGDALALILPVIADMVRQLLPVFQQLWQQVLVPLIPVVMQLVQALLPIIPLIAELVATLLPPLIELFTAILEPVIALIGPLAEALAPVLELIAGLIAEYLVPWIEQLADWLGSLLEAVAPVISALAEGLAGALETVIGWVTGAADGISAFVTGAIDGIKGFVEDVGRRLEDVMKWFRDLPAKIRGIFSQAGEWLVDAGKRIIEGLWNGLKSMWDNVTGWFEGIGDWIQEHKGPREYDLALLVPAGQWIMEGFQEGLESQMGRIERSLRDFTGDLAAVQVPAIGAEPAALEDVELVADWPAGRSGARPITINDTGDPYAMARAIRRLEDFEEVVIA